MKKQGTVLIVLLLVSAMLFSACSAKNAAMDYAYTSGTGAAEAPTAMNDATATAYAYSMKTEAMPEPMPAEAGKEPADGQVRKIIYNANMTVTAEDPAIALQDLIAQAEALGGYIGSTYTRTDELGAYRCTAELKVPAEKLELLVAAAENAGKVDSYNLTSDDVSMDYYDIAARLASAQAEEKQLLSILEKCETVEDILAVRSSLASVRSDIESYQGRINLWDNLVSYATLSITINRTARAAVEKEKELLAIWKASDVWKKMVFGFQNSGRFLVNAVGAIGIFLAYAAIPVIAILIIVFVVRKLDKGGKARREARREKKAQKKAAKLAQKAEKALKKNA